MSSRPSFHSIYMTLAKQKHAVRLENADAGYDRLSDLYRTIDDDDLRQEPQP